MLLQPRGIDTWLEGTIYQQLGRPVTDEVFKYSGQKPDQSAPNHLLELASFRPVDLKYISERVLLIDLGEAFSGLSPPFNGIKTPVSCCSLELILDTKASGASDIWAFACTIFEIRSGFAPFESFVGSSAKILIETLRILGMPSQSSYSLWKKSGITITGHAQNEGSILNDRVSEIGIDDQESFIRDGDATSLNDHSLLEPSGRRAIKDEVSVMSRGMRLSVRHPSYTKYK